MDYKFSFEKLKVWVLAKELSVDIYRISESFPENEKFGLQSQIRRAAISVSSNIAEGSSRLSVKSKGNFYQIAYSSLMETYSQLHVASDLGYIKLNSIIVDKVIAISNLLNSLHKSTKRS